MRATSAAQAATATELSVPDLEEIRPGTWAVPLSMPEASLGYVFCYVLADDEGGLQVIDPGWPTDHNWAVLVNALGRIGRSMSQVRGIVLTHLHRDHVGLAPRLRAASGVSVTVGAVEHEGMRELAQAVTPASAQWQLERWGVPPARQGEILGVTFPSRITEPLLPGRILADGDVLDMPGRTVRAVLTPGHTSGHMCFVDEDDGLILTGDHVLPTVYPGLGLGGSSVSNPVVDYLESLERLAPFDGFEVLPGHGFRFTGLAERRAELAEHVEHRTKGVAAVLDEVPTATVWQIAERLEWTAGWHNLRGAMLRSALLQTGLHADRVNAERHP